MKSTDHDKAEAYTHASTTSTEPPHVRGVDMDKISAFLPLTGQQVVGTGSHPTHSNRFLMAHYWSPAIIEVELVPTKDGGVKMMRKDWIGWVWLPDHSGKVRLFPKMTPGSDGKRIQTVQYGPDGQIWMTRNGETGCSIRDPNGILRPGGIWKIRPIKNGWQLMDPPLQISGPDEGHVESMLIRDATLYALRSRQDGSAAWLTEYQIISDGHDVITLEVPQHFQPPNSPWMYGIGWWDEMPYYVTDACCDPKKGHAEHGIYRGSRLIVQGVTGSSIFFTAEGDAIVPQYGENIGEFGQPCVWTRVPAAMLGH